MNVALIGMPSSGKSSVGVILAKIIAYNFVDTDILIQNRMSMTLQEIVNRYGYLKLREIEAEVILSLRVKDCVIATGGSVVYSADAMSYLKKISRIVYLRVSFNEMKRRLGDYSSRGLAKPIDQTIEEMFNERSELYERYKDFIFINEGLSATKAAIKISELLESAH